MIDVPNRFAHMGVLVWKESVFPLKLAIEVFRLESWFLFLFIANSSQTVKLRESLKSHTKATGSPGKVLARLLDKMF